MCNGFGGIVTKDGRILFCEPDSDGDCSHSELLSRLHMEDNRDPFMRPFVRFEFPEWTADSFSWDERNTLPGWVTDEHQQGCVKLLERCAPAWAEYKKVLDTALAEYKKVRAPALAEYKKVLDTAWAAFIRALSSITGYVSG